MEQGSKDWHAARLGVLTGSRAGDLMGTKLARQRYLVEKAVEIATGEHKTIQSKYLEFGHQQEPHAIRAYEFQTGRKVEPAAFVTWHGDDRIGCSPDGLVTNHEQLNVVIRPDPDKANDNVTEVLTMDRETNGVVEVKSRWDASKHVEVILTNKVPKDHVWQCHWNYWVTNRGFCDYVSWCPAMPPASQLHIITVERDDAAVIKMQDAALLFLRELDELIERLL